MQSSSTQKQEAEGSAPANLVLRFEERLGRYFDAEFTEQGRDVIYHFWPPGESTRFTVDFLMQLEKGFVDTLPPGQRVRADYTTLQEASVQNIVRQREAMSSELVIPRETVYVRVIDGVELPLYEKYLKHKIFENIEKVIEEN